LFILLLIAAFLLGRYQGQLELLKIGVAPSKVSNTQTAGDQGSQQQGQQQAQQQTQPSDNIILTDEQWQDVMSDAILLEGKDNALVTIVEFTDYQCPYCARYISETYPQIIKDYVDTGKVRYMLRDFPLPFHPNSHTAAEAARCAGDQGKYVEMHDVLFEKQEDWSNADVNETFSGYAGDIGMNTESFSDCLSSGKYKSVVDKDLSLAQQLGVGGTPGFFINGTLLVGAQPFDSFKTAIEAEL
jgi:protein-disulfide isomerase